MRRCEPGATSRLTTACTGRALRAGEAEIRSVAMSGESDSTMPATRFLRLLLHLAVALSLGSCKGEMYHSGQDGSGKVPISVYAWVSPVKNYGPGGKPRADDPRWFGADGMPLYIRNTTEEAWEDVWLELETVDSRGRRETLKRQFVGLWKPGEDQSVPYPYSAEKTLITLTRTEIPEVFVLYELPEIGSEAPVVPRRQ